jgi:hypothetical protein
MKKDFIATFIVLAFVFLGGAISFAQWRVSKHENAVFHSYKATPEKTLVTWKLKKGESGFIALKCDAIEVTVSDSSGFHFVTLKSVHHEQHR